MSTPFSFDPASESYVSLATFRRTGKEVRTPVWIAGAGDTFYVYTNRTSGKVKRIRHTPRVRLAPCDARGRLRGDWCEAKARMIDDREEQKRGFEAIIAKYGWQMRFALLLSRISRRYEDRTIIEIKPG